MAEWREQDRVGTSADTSSLPSPRSRYQKAVLRNDLEFLNEERKGKERVELHGLFMLLRSIGSRPWVRWEGPERIFGTLPKESWEVPKARLGAGLKARREVKSGRPVGHAGDLARKVGRVPWVDPRPVVNDLMVGGSQGRTHILRSRRWRGVVPR